MRFSHRYIKFQGYNITEAVLLEVLKVDKKDLSAPFLDYDTAYRANASVQYYPLKDGPYLLLILKAPGLLFTTLRPWTLEKEAYYYSRIGQRIEIIITEEEKRSDVRWGLKDVNTLNILITLRYAPRRRKNVLTLI